MRFLFPAALASALLLGSCSEKSANTNSGKSAQESSVPVLVAKATQQDVPVNIDAVGTVQAYSFVSIRSQITDDIVKVHFREGQEVKQGDLLFTLDQRPAEA